ncbi:hypothetical protein [Streptomyces sp. E-15]
MAARGLYGDAVEDGVHQLGEDGRIGVRRQVGRLPPTPPRPQL